MRSAIFDDIYFSAEDGLAETKHTFLGGNDLPSAWSDGRARFCIAETGFGTGLNMLAAWRLFEETAKPHQRLDLISIEKYPLSTQEIRQALSCWDLQPQLGRLLALYPLRVPGFHRLNLSERVTLTLVFGDVKDVLPQVSAFVDAWFLDGFAPAKNPDMWTGDLYAQMARLSHDGASVATFTAAGDVRRGLQAAGFAVEKRNGYGRKRDMVVGRYNGPVRKVGVAAPRRVEIIGAGLAGLSAAWHLRREGIEAVVYDDFGIAAGASGSRLGIINPKLTVHPSAQGRYYSSAYSYALRHLDAGRAGALHLQTDEDKRRKFTGYLANLGWGEAHMKLLSAVEASDIAGVRIDVPALHYPDAAYASPRDICKELARDIEVRSGKPSGDVIILANGAGVKNFCDVPVESVRGQVSSLAPSAASSAMRANICYGGYITPVAGGAHMCGATFQPWGTSPGIEDADHARNVGNLAKAVPSLGDMRVIDGWAGFRAAAKDRFPLVGSFGVSAYRDVRVSVAHGSHGMISGFMAGAILAADLAGAPAPVGRDVLSALDPARFGA